MSERSSVEGSFWKTTAICLHAPLGVLGSDFVFKIKLNMSWDTLIDN